MLNLSKLVAGRIYSFRHTSTVEFKKFERDTTRTYAPEWLETVSVTKESAFKGSCANPDSYARKMRQSDPEWQPSEKVMWFQWENRNGIVSHKKTGKLYLALVNPETIKSRYFVNGVEATSEQLKEIERWRKSSGEFSDFALFDLEKVECQGVVE